MTLFDCVEAGMAKSIINLCDCFGHVLSPINIQLRVKYPGSYAADRMTRKGDPSKLGTVSWVVDNGCLIINAYVCYNVNDVRSSLDGSLFDPTYLFSCMHQARDILSDLWFADVYMSATSYTKFNIPHESLVGLLGYICNSQPYNVVLTV